MKAAILMFFSVLGVLLFASSAYAAPAADTIYYNGAILTMAGKEPAYIDALAVKDGRIVFAGSKDEAFALMGNETRLVDLNGKALLPGFIDGHSHYINSLLVANECNLYPPPSGPGKDVAAIVAELKNFAEKNKIPKGELIVAYGYDDMVMPNGRLLTRGDLDEAFPGNPVRVDHVSMHGTVLNTLALKLYGFSMDAKTPPGGVIVRKPGSQEPWGLIMETAFLPVLEKATPMTAQQEIDWTRAGQRLYAKEGITTAHEGATLLPHFQTMKRASDAGANLIDVIAFPFITDVDKIMAELPVSEWGKYNNRLKIGGVKITLDGSPQGRTAHFTTPYLTGGPGGEKDWKGEPSFPLDLVKTMFKKVYDLNVPLLVHCNGDAAIDDFLSAYEYARAGDFSRPWNVTAIHSQFLRKDQIAKYVQYKVRPSFYTLHTFYFAEAHIANRGYEQAMYISPMRDAIDAGLRPTNHTDFVVAPLDQMMVLWSAVNRISRAGASIGSDQRVTPYEGLKAMTEWAAEQYQEENNKGTLEVGKLADLVILDKDPLKVDALTIRDIKVLETIKEGTTIFPVSADTKKIIAPKLDGPAKTYSWTAHVCDMADVNQAANKEWRLKTLAGKTINVAKIPTLKFSYGQVAVFGGINQMSGTYALIGDSAVTIGNLASTKMAGPPEIMALEKEFAKVLASVDSFHVHGNELELFTKDVVTATFFSED